MLNDRKTDWLHYGSAGLVFLVSYLVFNWTKAPTVSFWDCGEFIASAAILGIPHPPGAPLYVVLNKVFTLLPIASDISVRVNMISVLTAAFTAMVGYLIVHRLLDYWTRDKEEWYYQAWKYIGGISGGLTLAFSRTFWSSAVEAEVYGLAMLMTLLIVYLGILWWQRPSEQRGNQYLILAGYLGILGTAVHMTVFLAFPALMLLVLLSDSEKRMDWRIWVTGAVLLLVVASLDMFLLSLAAWTLVTAVVVLYNPRTNGWRLPMFLCLAAVLGFSSQFFIPIRAAQEPRINENDPDDWTSFKYFLERKQYGQTSMIARAMKRRGAPENQFGRWPRMGFWGFFEKQYGPTGWLFAVPLFLGLFGMYESYRRSRSPGVMFIALIIFGTVGLVWYMNFADGTRQDPVTGEGYLEVRDRDYFWTPGFIAFALAIGLGLAAVGLKLVEWIKEKGLPRFAAVIPASTAALALAFPVFGAVSNFAANQRIGNYLPYDYAYNLLSSCEKDAILFTNGDNDTFPLWALQEAYGFRRDVRIVNLSLINTNWYIAQMKKQYGVPISLTDAEIGLIRPDFDQNTGQLSKRVQDKMIDNILEANQWKIPVHFSVTCAPESRVYRGRPLEPYLVMHGMVYRVVPEAAQAVRIDVPSTLKLYTETYRYRGVSDPKVRKDENDLRIIQNYVFAFVYYVADTLRKAGDWTGAEAAARRGISLAPRESFGYHYLTQMLVDRGRFAAVESLLAHTPLSAPVKDSLRFYLGAAYYRKGDIKKAEEIYLASYQRDKQNGFRDLFSFYYETKNYRQCLQLAQEWLAAYPNDSRAGELQTILTQIQTLLRADSAGKSPPDS